MSEQKTMDTNKENIKEKSVDKQVFEIYSKGVKAWYQYKKCQTGHDSEEMFYRLLDLIEDGKELLFDNNTKEQELDSHLQEIFKITMNALDTCPDRIEETVVRKDMGDEKIPIVVLSSDDAGTTECFQEDIEKTRIAFEKRQYKYHIPCLLKAHNLLFHELVSSGIISQFNPSVDEMIDDMIKTGIKEGM